MALTLYTLPYQEKLKEESLKTVSFKVSQGKGRNRYIQSIGQGYNNIKTSLELEYINLTESERAAVEVFFSIQQTYAVISYLDKVFNVQKVYKMPRSWQVARQRLVPGLGLPDRESLAYSIKFTLESFP